jgi:hypothetical protein
MRVKNRCNCLRTASVVEVRQGDDGSSILLPLLSSLASYTCQMLQTKLCIAKVPRRLICTLLSSGIQRRADRYRRFGDAFSITTVEG